MKLYPDITTPNKKGKKPSNQFASFNEEEPKMISLDDLQADYPWECIEYALKKNLLKTEVGNEYMTMLKLIKILYK